MMDDAEYPWSAGIWDCTADCGICCQGFWCLPCLYGQNVAKTRRSGCCAPCMLYLTCPFFACWFAGNHRGQVRDKYKLYEAPYRDCCVHLCCSPFGVCQEVHEAKLRSLAAMPAPLSKFAMTTASQKKIELIPSFMQPPGVPGMGGHKGQ